MPRGIDYELKKILRRKISERTGKPLGKATRDYAAATLRRALQFAVEQGAIPFNPASKAARASRRERRETETERVKFFTPEESLVFLKAATEAAVSVAEDDVPENRYAFYFAVALTTGAGPGELFGLKLNRVDLENKTMRIERSCSQTKRRKGEEAPRYRLKATKNEHRDRTISLSDFTVEMFRNQIRLRNTLKSLAGGRWQEQGFLFTTNVGTHLEHSNTLEGFKAFLRANRLPEDRRVYDLRHTHASDLLEEGFDLKYVADRLGHSTVTLTANTYGHLFNRGKRDLADRLNRRYAELLSASREPEAAKVVAIPKAMAS